MCGYWFHQLLLRARCCREHAVAESMLLPRACCVARSTLVSSNRVGHTPLLRACCRREHGCRKRAVVESSLLPRACSRWSTTRGLHGLPSTYYQGLVWILCPPPVAEVCCREHVGVDMLPSGCFDGMPTRYCRGRVAAEGSYCRGYCCLTLVTAAPAHMWRSISGLTGHSACLEVSSVRSSNVLTPTTVVLRRLTEAEASAEQRASVLYELVGGVMQGGG